MTINPIRSTPLAPTSPGAPATGGPGFKEALIDSLKETNDLQNQAQKAMEGLASGKSNNLHETMIAIQKAEVSFKMLTQVRNKIMNAYQEIMRMQV